METTELIDIFSQDEQGRHQLKTAIANVDILVIKKAPLNNTAGEHASIGTTRGINITRLRGWPKS